MHPKSTVSSDASRINELYEAHSLLDSKRTFNSNDPPEAVQTFLNLHNACHDQTRGIFV